jgi:hypothetical protein
MKWERERRSSRSWSMNSRPEKVGRGHSFVNV